MTMELNAAARLLALNEVDAAVPLKLVRPVMGLFNRARYAQVFNKYGSGKGKDKYRIYVPLNIDKPVVDKVVPDDIQQAVSDKGYTVDNYSLGLAIDKAGKRTIKIGKLLSGDLKLLQKFANDPTRGAAKQSNLIMVISRHPYDIIGMSFDRGWTSCMHAMDGGNRDYLKADVKYGTLVAYLVRNDDKNINNPVARCAIKPYAKHGGPLILGAGPVYGTAPTDFRNYIKKFIDYMNSAAPAGRYVLVRQLYDDGVPLIFHGFTAADLPEDETERMEIAEATDNAVLLEELAKDQDRDIRGAVAGNILAPASVLEALAKDRDGYVRYGLAQNPSAPASVLALLSKDKDVNTQLKVSINLNTGPDTLAQMSGSKIPEIRYNVANNRSTTPEVLMVLSKDRDEETRQAVANNPRAPVAALAKLAWDKDSDVCKEVARNPSTPADLLAEMVTHSNDRVRLVIAQNENTPADVLANLAKDKFSMVRNEVAVHKNTSNEVLQMLAGDVEKPVRKQAQDALKKRGVK